LVAEKADIFIAVGIRSHYSVEQAQKKKMKKRDIFSFNEAEEAARFLKNTIEEGDVVLVKGSQSMRMERTVEAIMEKPEEAKELLVRQDPMWLKR